jgi:dTDP-4-dehydrorhamnose reductase
MTPRRWVVVGARGMLGRDVCAALEAAGASDVVALGRDEVDVSDAASVSQVVGTALGGTAPDGTGQPDGHLDAVLVNCAAWTAVDDAQSHEAQAFAVNALGPHLLARACAAAGAWMLQVSTDYVFDGTATQPYPESAPAAPRSAYGRTKAAGEWAVRAALPDRHWVVRTGWLYGAHGRSFVTTMRALAGSRPTVEVVTDQVGQPTWSADLAERIVATVRAGAPAGTYHGTSSGRASWFELAQAVFVADGHDPARVLPTTSETLVRPAPRPAWSVLGHDAWSRAGLGPLPHWHDALTRFVGTGSTG